MTDAFGATLDELDRASNPPEVFCSIAVETLPVTGAAVSTLGNVLGSETLAASDEVAARLDELQFDLGEGPCWEALETGSPSLHPDIQVIGRERWPSLSEALRSEPIVSVFAFPLVIGPLRFGAIDLYSSRGVALSGTQTSRVTAMADVIGRHVMRRALDTIGVDPVDSGNAFSRRLIHQATGKVLAQLEVSADDARLIIQGHAFSHGRPMMEVAQRIIDGDLQFARRNGSIEVVE